MQSIDFVQRGVFMSHPQGVECLFPSVFAVAASDPTAVQLGCSLGCLLWRELSAGQWVARRRSHPCIGICAAVQLPSRHLLRKPLLHHPGLCLMIRKRQPFLTVPCGGGAGLSGQRPRVTTQTSLHPKIYGPISILN